MATTTQAGRTERASARRGAVVRGMTAGSQSFDIEFDARTAYDFLVSLEIEHVEEMDISPDDRRWLTEARAALSPERRRDLAELFGEGSNAYGSGIGAMVVALPSARTAREFVAALAVTDTRTIVSKMLGEITRDTTAAAQLERILDGADDEIAAFAERTGDYHCDAVTTLLAAPSSAIDRLRGLLTEWLVHFEQVEARVDQIIHRDVSLRQADRSLPPVELVERTTGGVRWLGEAGVGRVILAPSYFARPLNYLFSGQDWRLFAYPVADEAVEAPDAGSPPPAMIRLYRALGDESRLRILRLLRERDMYLTELALALEVSKPTMKHHLTQLRAAGLVTVTDLGAQTYYSLRRDRLPEAGDDLMRFLG
jgi:DNA-binding transcriptional ArsR family regulator